MYWEVKQAPPTESPPTEPVVKCNECGKDFVWWLHPIQACDDCVAKMYSRCSGTDIAGDPCRGYAVAHLDDKCISCHELDELCRQHDEWYDEHGGEA